MQDILIKQIDVSEIGLKRVLALSVGNATENKIQQVIESYDEYDNHLFGAFISDELIAVIGFEISDYLNIRHISVLKSFRKLGMGTKLINYVTKLFKPNQIRAQTDDEAVCFYQCIGFTCKAFKGEHSTRYVCSMDIVDVQND